VLRIQDFPAMVEKGKGGSTPPFFTLSFFLSLEGRGQEVRVITPFVFGR